MPKKFSLIDYKEWLQRYDGGETEKSIAKNAKCDVRTVRKGLARARLFKDAADAKVELIKEALHKHQADLLRLVEEIILALKVPSEEVMMLPWQWKSDHISIGLEGVKWEFQRNEPAAGHLTLVAETEDEWVLLREHLRNDPLWAALAQWKKALVAHLLERVEFESKAAALLRNEKAGYRVVDSRDGPPPVIDFPTTVVLFIKATLRRAMGIRDITDFEEDIEIDSTNGFVTYGYGRLLLAEAPGVEKQCREHLLDVFCEMQALPEAGRVASTYAALAEATARARQVAKEISLLGLVLGQCRICRRLGM